ncbi:MAG: hypothetical protein U0231_01750 [Nitrospiraceae bacterium]
MIRTQWSSNWKAGAVCGIVAAVSHRSLFQRDKPKPMAQPSPEQVKGNADRAFDKLKQEERDHKPADVTASQPTCPEAAVRQRGERGEASAPSKA